MRRDSGSLGTLRDNPSLPGNIARHGAMPPARMPPRRRGPVPGCLATAGTLGGWPVPYQNSGSQSAAGTRRPGAAAGEACQRNGTTSPKAQQETASAPLGEALASVGDRWTLLVVEALLAGPQRFNDLLDQLPGMAANILSERLKRLEREGLLVARPLWVPEILGTHSVSNRRCPQ
jgi:HxlR-like helix-turn-helix